MTATVPHVTPAVTATWNNKQRAEVNTVIGHPFSRAVAPLLEWPSTQRYYNILSINNYVSSISLLRADDCCAKAHDQTAARPYRFEKEATTHDNVEEIDNDNDMLGLSNLISCCDYVLTISNTTAHLSGGLGIKTMLMLPKGKGAFWYWSSDNTQSLWYKSIDIYRQSISNSWDEVTNDIMLKLKKYE